MNKMFAVMKREYLQAVRKKMFIIMTILLPFLMAGITILPGFMMAKGMGVKRVAVLDGTGRLESAFAKPDASDEAAAKPADQARKAATGRPRRPEIPTDMRIEYVNQAGAKDLKAGVQPYLDRLTRDKDASDKLEGVFVIPASAVNDPSTQMTYYSRSATELIAQERMSRLANKSLQRMRLRANGINPELVNDLLEDLPVQAVQLSRSGEQKTGGELNFIFAFILAALLMIPSLVYGQETMRGIVQEKTDRVVEVLISSVSPIQLLSGKIIGIAAVGLTQIFVWLTMIGLVGVFGAATLQMADVNVTQFIRPAVFVFFFIFFILGYMTYVCVYAIAGAVCNTEKEAQQFVMPVMLLMMVPWFMMMPIVLNADAPFAVAMSLSPVFGPLTMFARVTVTDVPWWHILGSILISIATIAGFFWVTAKIFRVGILSYGKRPTIPELLRWVRVA
jgi:ABC-2 type transport system permease protein